MRSLQQFNAQEREHWETRSNDCMQNLSHICMCHIIIVRLLYLHKEWKEPTLEMSINIYFHKGFLRWYATRTKLGIHCFHHIHYMRTHNLFFQQNDFAKYFRFINFSLFVSIVIFCFRWFRLHSYYTCCHSQFSGSTLTQIRIQNPNIKNTIISMTTLFGTRATVN